MMKSTTIIQVASCQFHQFGSAGLQQSLNALCILTHNILVDKVNIIIIELHILEENNLCQRKIDLLFQNQMVIINCIQLGL